MITSTDLIQFTPGQIDIIRQTVAAGVPPAEFQLFLEVCKHRGLNPLNREIYAIMRYDPETGGKRMTIQVSIDGLRIQAERSRKYLGQLAPEWCGRDGKWVDVWLDDEPPTAARVRVMRADFKNVVTATAKYGSYVQLKKSGGPTSMWAKMPDVMLAKCAEALALRKAFPETTAGLYTHEEMGQADNQAPVNTVDSTVTVSEVPSEPEPRKISPVRTLFAKGHQAGLWDDTNTFRQFCADVLGREVADSKFIGRELEKIGKTIDEELARLSSAEEVASEYPGMDEISEELLRQQQSA